MANRYWVGGSGTWVTGGTTKWSAASALSFTASCSGTTLTTVGSPALVNGMTVWSSTNVSLGTITGGSGNTWTVSVGGTYTSQTMKAATTGASVPSAADSVFFDANSSGTTSYTVTMSGAINCLDFTVSGLTPTFASTGTPTVAGSLTLASGTVWTGTGTLTFSATTTGKTITTNGTSMACPFVLSGTGGGWTLGSALTCTSGSGFTVTRATFSTGNFNMTLSGSFSSSNTNTRSISLGSSTINISASTPIVFTTTTGLTFNAGTSQINISASTPTFNGSGRTYYNVAFTSTVPLTSLAATVSGVNTFNNLAVSGPSSTGYIQISFSANQTINGIFSPIGASPTKRIFVYSDTPGTSRSLTLNGGAVAVNCDFRDINAVGGLDVSADGGGDCGGNTNITFPAPKTVYWNLGGGSKNWSATGWAAASGGSPDAANFPLAQDTAVFNDASSVTSVTIDNAWNIGSVDMSSRSLSMTLSTSSFTSNVHGNWANGAGVTLGNGGGRISFRGRGGTQQIVGNGVPFTPSWFISNIGGTVRLQDAITVTGIVTHSNGTLDLQSYTLTAQAIDSSNTATRTIAFGTGNITVNGAGGTLWNTTTTTNLAVTGTPTVNVSYSGATAVTIAGTGLIDFNFTAGTYSLSVNTTRSLNFTGFSGTVPNQSISIAGGLTLSTTASYTSGATSWTFFATSGTWPITSNGVSLGFPVTFNGAGGTWQLQDNASWSSNATTLTKGTIDLNNKTLFTGTFSSDNTNVRGITFGTTGRIKVYSTGSVWNTATATNLTVSGTPAVDIMYALGTGVSVSPGSPTEANSISFYVPTGTFTFTVNAGSVRDLDLSPSTTFNGTLANTALTIYGNLRISSATTVNAGANVYTFAATSGTKTITTNGKTLDFPLTFDGAGGTWQLQDALTMGSTRTLTHTNGTIDLNGKTLTAGASYTTATGTKNLTFNAGTLTCPAASVTAFNNAAPTGYTTTAGTGTGYIAMTAATAKTFVGGGSTFNCTLRQSGAGALSITGANTFSDIANTTRPVTVTFPASTTNTFSNFSLSGTAGNLVTINSSSAGTQATISDASGTINASYLSIRDSAATGGATWNAFTSTDVGNNTGWNFVSTNAPGNFFSFLTN